MIYCDTSLIVAAFTHEVNTEAAASWLAGQTEGDLAISPWVETELASAMSIKVRTGRLGPADRSRALQDWRTIQASRFEMLSIEQQDFGFATQLLDRPNINLRAGDALHIAIAIRHNLSIATLDNGMMNAAVLAGLTVEPVLPIT